MVIGETCVIGDRVRIYQGVTLGAKSFPRDDRGHPIKGIERHPIIEDDVVIYSGATILGRVTHRRRLDHRRQRLADPQRASRQPHLAGPPERRGLRERRRDLIPAELSAQRV